MESQDFLTPPSRWEVHRILSTLLNGKKVSESSPAPETTGSEQTQNVEKESPPKETGGTGSSEDNSDDKTNLKRKSIFSFGQPPAKTKCSELDLYLSEPVLENGSSLFYWKSALRFPQLQDVARKLLAAPASSGGFDRLYPMATCIVKAKRNHLLPHTTERLLLYKNSAKVKPGNKVNGAPKQ